jgi:hypothetical protein
MAKQMIEVIDNEGSGRCRVICNKSLNFNRIDKKKIVGEIQEFGTQIACQLPGG